jgi:Ca2+-binding RTX toxin-like protein
MALSDLDAQVTFLSGVDSSGKVASPRYQITQKWGDPLIGTASGTISYSFDAASGWTNLEKETITDALALWSAVANVTFAASGGGSGDLIFLRNADVTGAGYPLTATRNTAVVGSPDTLPDGSTQAVVLDLAESTYLSGVVGNTFGGEHPLGTPAHLDLMHELGHALGLGHAGAYNYAANPLTQQFGPYDTRLWTLESYIGEAEAAQYSSAYPVTGSFWANVRPSTPMMLDILALQRLYGAPTNSPLNGDDTFGYHSTITGALGEFYNFDNLFRPPVITLFSTGTHNTLDLSGITSASRINLEPGSFSSVGGLVNNIGIDFHTIIETAIGGSGNDTIKGNGENNRLDGATGDNTFTGGLGADEFDISGTDIITDLGLGGADFFRVGPGRSVVAHVADNWTAPSQNSNYGNATIQANGHNVSLQQAVGSGFGAHGYTIHNIGNDTAVFLRGSVGEDSITGGNGDDWLYNIDGNDTMTGGLGRDRFIIDAGSAFIFDLGIGADELNVDTAGTVEATLAANWTPTSATTNRGRVLLSAAGHNLDLSHVSDVVPSPLGFTISNHGNASAVTLIGSLRDDIITGGLGDDFLSGKRGADTIDLGDVLDGGSDTVLDRLADLDGDRISGFAPGDAIDITGALIGRNNLSVTLGPGSATLAAGGVSFQLNGDFSGGEFVTAARGSGVNAHTTITFQTHVLGLQEGVAVDPSKINGVVDEAFLTGDGSTVFTLTLKSAESAYANTLGVFRVAADGKISDVHIAFANTLNASTATLGLGTPADGERIGFFLIQDGFNRYGILPDNLSLVIPGTAIAADLDDGLPPALRSATLGQLNGAAIFYSYSTLNPGDANQALSGVTMGGRELQVCFEDQFNGDNDFQDIVIGVTTNADNLFIV